MTIIEQKENCCGCMACSQICPKQCIHMNEDNEGFLYPVVDKSSCINCGLCKKVCPILTKPCEGKISSPPDVFVAYNLKDEVRSSSSSGGLFTPLAEKILEIGGVVFGAAFDDEFLVRHTYVENKEQLIALQGSKYLQSRIEQTFCEVKSFLQQGRTVLYSGTACQIAGLKSFLDKEYENLYTIDVLCHGVPSPKFWKYYLAEQEKLHDGSVQRMFFRHKKYGWKTYVVLLEFSNDTTYECIFNKDAFMQLFLANICLRPSCHACRFKDANRPSDITLGDCWGIENYMPEMDDNGGTSVVLVHSKKGKQLLALVSNSLKLSKAELDRALPVTADSRKSVAAHYRRDKFFKYLNKGKPISKMLKLLEPSFGQRAKRKIKRLLGRN